MYHIMYAREITHLGRELITQKYFKKIYKQTKKRKSTQKIEDVKSSRKPNK